VNAQPSGPARSNESWMRPRRIGDGDNPSGRAGSRQVKDTNVSFVGASAPIVTGTTLFLWGSRTEAQGGRRMLRSGGEGINARGSNVGSGPAP
jgi:hypothetical protein